MTSTSRFARSLAFLPVLLLGIAPASMAAEFQRTDIVPFGALIPVPIDTAWTPTGVYIEQGDLLLITADGIASTEYPPSRLFNWFGPEGGGYLEDHGEGLLTQHSLIGRIGESGTAFQVGRGTHGVALASGELYLGYNDSIFSDNYGYYLAYIVMNGYPHVAAVTDPPFSPTVALRQNFPNPFRPATRVPFALAAAGQVELSIFDVQGRMVRQLVNDRMEAGEHVIGWDGRDQTASPLPAGSYFYMLRVDGRTVGSQKSILLDR